MDPKSRQKDAGGGKLERIGKKGQKMRKGQAIYTDEIQPREGLFQEAFNPWRKGEMCRSFSFGSTNMNSSIDDRRSSNCDG